MEFSYWRRDVADRAMMVAACIGIPAVALVHPVHCLLNRWRTRQFAMRRDAARTIAIRDSVATWNGGAAPIHEVKTIVLWEHEHLSMASGSEPEVIAEVELEGGRIAFWHWTPEVADALAHHPRIRRRNGGTSGGIGRVMLSGMFLAEAAVIAFVGWLWAHRITLPF